jgi:hypothetical protein
MLAVLAVLSIGLAVLALGPALAPGFVLTYDMVFTPRQDLTPAALGLGTEMPRAVPADAVVALGTAVLPGDLLQKLVLLVTIAAAIWGAARLAPARSCWARAAAGLAYGWNPYVAERLFIGHWSLLVAYAALPWAARAGLDLRAGRPAGPRLLVACGVAAITPTGGILAAATGLAAAGWRGARTFALAAGLVVLNLPWLVPAVLHPGGGGSDPAGVAAFAARAENWSGTVGSVLGFGGIWNAQVVPPSRTTVAAPLLSALVLAVAAAGVRPLAAAWGPRAARALGLVAAGGLLVALLGAVPGGAAVLRWVVAEIPGGGLLRDGQKWLAPFVLVVAVCFGLGAARLAGRLADPLGRRSLAAGALLLPLALLPDLAWGGFGRLAAVEYPDDWREARRIIREADRAEQPGDLVALPFAAFRAFPWNGGRTMLDPAPRWFPVTVVADDALPVGDVIVAGEDPRAAAVRQALATGRPLGEAGVGWVLVEKGVLGAAPETALRGLDRVHDGPALALYRVPSVRPPAAARPRAAPVIAGDLAAIGLLFGSVLVGVGPFRYELVSFMATRTSWSSRQVGKPEER